MPVLSFHILAFAFAAFFPLSALMPRAMPFWAILSALALLPCAWKAVRTLKNRNAFAVLIGLGLALGYTVLSTSWSPSLRAHEASIDFLYTSLCGIIIVLALPFFSQDQIRTLLRLMFGGWLVGLVFLMIEAGFDFPIHRAFNGIAAGTPVAENVPKRVAALFALGLWPVALFLECVKKRAAAIAAVLFFCLIGTFLTNRSAIAGLALGTIILFLAYYRAALARGLLIGILVIGLVGVVPLALLLPNGPGAANDLLFASANHRIKIWVLTAGHVLEAPFLGHGIDASRGIYTKVDENGGPYLKEGTSIISQHPHNIFLQLWLDFGFVGTVLWGVLMIFLAVQTRFLPAIAQPYVLAALFCSLAMLNTTFTILQAWWSSGHMATAAMLLLGSYSAARNAASKGTSAGGMA